MNFFIFILSYFLIVISVVGYGLLFNLSFEGNGKKINFGYAGLLGIFIFVIYSFISSFFISHNIIHNFIIFFFGVLIFFIKLKNNLKFNKQEYLFFFLIFIILFISSLVHKTNEDFPYYHFNYTMLLVERESVLGVGFFNHGFRTPSSLFYINSLFFLPYIKYYSFHMTALLIMGFGNLILLQKIVTFLKENKVNFITYLCLLSFIYINVVFYRIAEHGTDRSAQILVFILVIEILLLINFFNVSKYSCELKKILILIGIIVSLKAFYILYLIFIIYLLFFLFNKITFNQFIKENFFYLFFLSILITSLLIINLQNSACLLYPVKFTCFFNLPWSFSEQEITRMSIHYENWAKAGSGPNYKSEMDPQIYIQNFNWLANWVKRYFAEKGVNTFFGTLVIAIITILTFYSRKKNYLKNNKYKVVLTIIFILFFEWFWKHPDLRYGGFCLLALMLYIPSSLILEKFYQQKIKKKMIVLISVALLVFTARNINRILFEIKQYNYQPFNHTFYYLNQNEVNENFFVPNKKIQKLIENFENCLNTDQRFSHKYCIEINKEIGLFYGKFYFKNKS